MTPSGSALAALAATIPLALMFLVALCASRRAERLDDAIRTHFHCRHGRSRARADYKLWSQAGLPVRCLACGWVNTNFNKCINPECGVQQPFEDARGSKVEG